MIADRDKWASKAEFILSSIGYCVGIGNVWSKFEFLIQTCEELNQNL